MVRVLLYRTGSQGSQGLRGLQDSGFTRHGLATTVPVLRPCPGPLVEISRLCCLFGDHSIIHKRTWVAGVKTFIYLFIYFLEITYWSTV